MNNCERSCSYQFHLVQAAHYFLLDVLPFRSPASLHAISRFVSQLRSSCVPVPQLDAILLRCLAVLNRHAGNRLPSLVDAYVSGELNSTDSLERFAAIAEGALLYNSIVDVRIQRAIEIIRARYEDHKLSPSSVADAIGVRLPVLCTAFKRAVYVTLSRYIRDVRLDQASLLLATTSLTVKEVWSKVGYNYGSNFDHDFRSRFNCSPTSYREQIVQPMLRLKSGSASCASAQHPTAFDGCRKTRALVVDDEPEIASMMSTHLSSLGYSTFEADCGQAGTHAFASINPDVVLVDYHLGDMTGIDCLRRIRANKAPEIAILFTADLEHR